MPQRHQMTGAKNSSASASGYRRRGVQSRVSPYDMGLAAVVPCSSWDRSLHGRFYVYEDEDEDEDEFTSGSVGGR